VLCLRCNTSEFASFASARTVDTRNDLRQRLRDTRNKTSPQMWKCACKWCQHCQQHSPVS